MKIRNVKWIMQAGKETSNGRLYLPEVLEATVKEALPLILQGKLLGSPNSHLTKAGVDISHRITSLNIKGDEVLMDIVILKTPAGVALREYMDEYDEPTLVGLPSGPGDYRMVDRSIVITHLQLEHVDVELEAFLDKQKEGLHYILRERCRSFKE